LNYQSDDRRHVVDCETGISAKLIMMIIQGLRNVIIKYETVGFIEIEWTFGWKFI